MRLQRYASYTVFLLILCGSVCVAWRYHVRHHWSPAAAQSAWRLTYKIQSESKEPGVTIRLAAPADTPHSRLVRQDIEQGSLRIIPQSRSSSHLRELVATTEQAGRCEAAFRFDLRLTPAVESQRETPPPAMTSRQRARYLAPSEGVSPNADAVVQRLGGLLAVDSGDLSQAETAHRIFDSCRNDLRIGERGAPDDASTALSRGIGTALGRNRAMIALCRAAGLPARPVAGFRLSTVHRAAPIVWSEVWLDDRWVPFDLISGQQGAVPANYVPVRQGAEEIVSVTEADRFAVQYTLTQLPPSALGSSATARRWTDVFDLTKLPTELRHLVSLILLMPLGAVITCFFRNVVGLKTTGTFTPMLLALGFIFADWRIGLMILLVALVLGVVTRYGIERLKLLMLPRLSIMMTLVVFCIVFGVSVMHHVRFSPGNNAVLLPMVILTMMVERFYITTQEDGAHVAIEHLFGTAIIGFCCFLMLCWDSVAGFILIYPEIHLFTVALLILLGRYTGYQLLEPWRFRDLIEFGQR